MFFKSLFIAFFLGVGSLCAQSTEVIDPHNGVQVSAFAGPAFGRIKGKTKDFGDIYFMGARGNGVFQIGYAYRNWAGGFSFGYSSLYVSTVEYHDTTYMTPYQSSIDNTFFGIYAKRYFMPINVFVTTDLGVSRYTIYDENSTPVAYTNRGFYWDLMVGKEFVIGKRKRFGIGPYLGVGGLKCKDLAPYDDDTYSYVAFSGGVVFSFH